MVSKTSPMLKTLANGIALGSAMMSVSSQSRAYPSSTIELFETVSPRST